MIIIILLSIFSLLNYIISIYYIYIIKNILYLSSQLFIYYIYSVLHLVPATFYLLNIIDFIQSDTWDSVLCKYPIEWIITIPILLLSLTNFKQVQIKFYYILTFLITLMNLITYTSFKFYLLNNKLIMYSFFYLGVVIYISILSILYFIMIRFNNTISNSTQYNIINNNKIYKFQLLCIIFSWTIYPIIYILLMNSQITIELSIILFTITDFLTKAIFTAVVMGYNLHKYKIIHPLNTFTVRITQIESEAIPTNEAQPGIADYTLTNVPVITQSETNVGHSPILNTDR